jgi:DNA-binding NarL/FixJ family response regulator
VAKIKVAIIDDQRLVREGVSLVINSQPDMEVVGQGWDGYSAISLVRATPCDVVLMDVRMPGMDGIAAAQHLLAATRPAPGQEPDAAGGGDGEPTPRVIMLTTFDIDEYLLAAIRAGASGFLLKDASPEDMLAAIRTVYKGGAVVAPTSTRRLLDHLVEAMPPEPDATALFDQLTDKELEILKLMAEGYTNTEIAATIYVAESTVKTHVRRILNKTGSRDRMQAVVSAYQHGLIRPGL